MNETNNKKQGIKDWCIITCTNWKQHRYIHHYTANPGRSRLGDDH